MYQNALSELQPDGKTAKRAQYEAFEFELEAPGIVKVKNGSYGDDADDHEYRVNVDGGVPVACECPDHEYRNRTCKHMTAVAIREPVLTAANNRPVATDGGNTAVVEPHTERGGDTSQLPSGVTASIVADTTQFDELPDFDVFSTACDCIQDSIELLAGGSE